MKSGFGKARLRAIEDGCLQSGPSRRDVLIMVTGVVASSLTPLGALATPSEVAEKINDFAGGAKPEPGRVVLGIPEAADNGASVPVTITVESPMTDADHCVAVMIGAEANPFPVVATFYFTPSSGKAEVTTRIRLAATQTVTAVAKMSDGKTYIDQKKVEVTAGGCG